MVKAAWLCCIFPLPLRERVRVRVTGDKRAGAITAPSLKSQKHVPGLNRDHSSHLTSRNICCNINNKRRSECIRNSAPENEESPRRERSAQPFKDASKKTTE